MSEKSRNIDSMIQNIFILDGAGIPVFARHYGPVLAESDTDSVLLAGFITAIDIFSRSSLNGKLNDIGLDQRRFFFSKTHNDFIFVISAHSPDKNVIDGFLVKLINHLQQTLENGMTIIDTMAEGNHIEMRDLLKDFGQTLDTWVFESSLEFTDIADDDNIQPKVGGEISKIDTKEFQQMMKSVENKTRKYLEEIQSSQS